MGLTRKTITCKSCNEEYPVFIEQFGINLVYNTICPVCDTEQKLIVRSLTHR